MYLTFKNNYKQDKFETINTNAIGGTFAFFSTLTPTLKNSKKPPSQCTMTAVNTARHSNIGQRSSNGNMVFAKARQKWFFQHGYPYQHLCYLSVLMIPSCAFANTQSVLRHFIAKSNTNIH
jgi:hypothetical protein